MDRSGSENLRLPRGKGRKTMFRQMRKSHKQISQEQCVQLLCSQQRGVLSVLGDNGYPYGLPLNHFYNPEDGKLYFHSGTVGHMVDAIKAYGKASFCVYDEGCRNEGDWALNIRSVIVFGRIEIVEDREKALAVVRKLCEKFTSDQEFIDHSIREEFDRTLFFALVPEHVTGKLVREA